MLSIDRIDVEVGGLVAFQNNKITKRLSYQKASMEKYSLGNNSKNKFSPRMPNPWPLLPAQNI